MFVRGERVRPGTLVPVGSCWESGGPEWLFVSTLMGFGLTVALGMLAWIAWAPPQRRPTPSRRERTITRVWSGALLGWGVFAFFAGNQRTLTDVLAAGAAGLVIVAIALVVHRAQRAALDGAPMPAGLATAYLFVRWSTTSFAVLALGIGTWSIVASIALGHSCAGT